MVSQFKPEVMKARFWELTAQKEALNSELEPFRKHRDALRDELRPRLAEFRAAGKAVAEVERPRMGEIDAELAVLARALGQKVGSRPDNV